MKNILFLMIAAMIALSSSATKIYVCGTKITGTTTFSAGGGTVNFNASSNTLTISNVYYLKSGSSNNGISVDECDNNLTINLVGNVTFGIGDADAVLLKSSGKNATINVSGYAHFYTSSSGHAGLKLQSQNVTINGSGQLDIEHINSSTSVNSVNAVKGGTGTENITFKIKKCTLKSNDARLYNLKDVTFNPTGSFGSDDYSTYITFTYYSSSSSSPHASSISNFYKGTGVKLLKPIVYYNESLNFLTVNNFSNEAVVADVSPVAVFNSSYFPDANFRSYLLSLYPKEYITQTDVNNRTSLNVAGKDIDNLTGVSYFSKLTSLDCRVNNLYSLPTLPSTLKDLRCQNNALTSLQSLPSGLKYLYCHDNYITSLDLPQSLEVLVCSNNRFTSLLMNNYNALTNVDCSNNPNLATIKINNNNSLQYLTLKNCPSLTTLECYQNIIYELNFSGCNAIQSINCSGNRLTTLSLQGNNALTTLDCSINQITSLGTLPSSLQKLYCSSNKFSGTFNLTGRSNLKTLDISSNPSITTINCYSNALTSLNVKNCSALTTLQCYSNQIPSLNLTGCSALVFLSCQNNQITSFVSLPTTLQTIYCNDNKLSGGTFDVSGRSALKILDIKNNPNFSGLKCNNCSLTSLSVSGCTGLTTLICNNNKLTSLDVSSLSNLTELNCNWNMLGTLNVSNKTKLISLNAGYNQLTSLNIQGCSVLNNLYLESNKLTSLSVQGCNALRTINCCLNKISASGANTLINSLCTIPSGSQGALRYIFPGYSSASYVENNVNLTDAQVRSARNKRWMPYKFVSGTGWVEIPVNTAIPDDVNGDGHVSSVDVTALYNYLLNNDSSDIVNGDQDGDGHISSVDVTVVYNILLGN